MRITVCLKTLINDETPESFTAVIKVPNAVFIKNNFPSQQEQSYETRFPGRMILEVLIKDQQNIV